MESSALAADYAHVARSCARLREGLANSSMAKIEFSTGDRFRFDFRFREAEIDDGHLPLTAPAPRLINLPSGEAYIEMATDEDIEKTLNAFSDTKKKLDAGAYKVEAIPDMAEVTGKRFEYMTGRPKNK